MFDPEFSESFTNFKPLTRSWVKLPQENCSPVGEIKDGFIISDWYRYNEVHAMSTWILTAGLPYFSRFSPHISVKRDGAPLDQSSIKFNSYLGHTF